MKQIYKIKRLCYEANLNVQPYEDNPTEEFNSYDEAWSFIEKLANEEVECLNDDCTKGVSFGIAEDESYDYKNKCVVNCYILENDYDNTGNTKTVTEYSIYLDFDITQIDITSYCDEYSFILNTMEDSKGNECYLGIDIPYKDDVEWRFWLLFENNNGEAWTSSWNISDKDKEYIKQKTLQYCSANGYTYNGNFFKKR